MTTRRVLVMLAALLMLFPFGANAAEEKLGIGYAEYNLEDSLLFGLDKSNIYCSAGDFDESYTLGSRECLNDGTFSFMTAAATRWNVGASQAKGAHIIVNLEGYKTFDKFIMSTGLDKGVYREHSYNLYDFSIYYWDDFKWIEIPIPLDTDTTKALLELKFEPVTTSKFKLESKQSRAFRVQELILFPPGVELDTTPRRIEQKKPSDYPEITISGRNYQYNEFIPERTYKREDNKVLYRPDKWTTFVSSKEVENIFALDKVHDNPDESVEFTYEGKKISFKAGRKSYIKDGKEIAMNVAPYMDGTAVFIPIRDLIHSFDLYMSWNDETGAVRIYDPRDMLLPTVRDLDYMPENGEYSPYKVYINGNEQTVWGACNNDFTQYECDSPDEEVEVTVVYDKAITSAEILPESRGLKGTISGNTFTFRAKCNDYLSIEINGDYRRPLFLFLLEPIEIPEAGENVIVLDKDDVYEFQNLQMTDNMTVYIGPNVVLFTNIWMQDVKNVKIIGNGIIISPIEGVNMTAYLSDGIHLEGMTFPQYKSWKINPYGCSNITIKNVREFSTAIGADGFDPYGCSNVLLDHMFTKLRDDAIAIKGGTKPTYTVPEGSPTYNNTSNITVQNCTYICMRTGNPIEIGFELNGHGKISDVAFKNIDVIRKGTDERGANWRASMTIHHSGSSDIENILYEDIRVSRDDEGFICLGYFYVTDYYWDGQTPRGGISMKNITYRNVEYNGEAETPSYLFNVMRNSLSDRFGMGIYLDKENPDYNVNVENVVLENVKYKGKHVDSLETAKECNFNIDEGFDVTFK